jgi:hypothetical protein
MEWLVYHLYDGRIVGRRFYESIQLFLLDTHRDGEGKNERAAGAFKLLGNRDFDSASQ